MCSRFKVLQGDGGHKLVISTSRIPLVLLSAFSTPIKAQMLGQKGDVRRQHARKVEGFAISYKYKKKLALSPASGGLSRRF